MLQVVDKKTGKAADVRALLNIKPETIKSDKLRDELEDYEMISPTSGYADEIA